MELEFAMLAENADTGKNGLLHIFGGGFERMLLENPLPVNLPPFVLIAKFRAKAEEFGRVIGVVVTLTSPSGEVTEITEVGPVEFKPSEYAPTDDAYATIIGRIMLGIQRVGTYTFRIVAEGRELKAIPLFVQYKPGYDPPSLAEA